MSRRGSEDGGRPKLRHSAATSSYSLGGSGSGNLGEASSAPSQAAYTEKAFIRDIHGKYTSMTHQLKEATTKLHTMEHVVNHSDTRYGNLNKSVENYQQQVQAVKKELHDVQGHMKQLEQHRQQHTQIVIQHEQKQTQMKAEHDQTRQQVAQLQALHDEVGTMKQSIQAIGAKITQLDQQEQNRLRDEIQRLRTEQQAAMQQELDRLRQSLINETNAMKQSLQGEVGKLNTAQQSLVQDVQTLKAHDRDFEAVKREFEAQKNQTKQHVEQTKQQVQGHKKEVDQQIQQLKQKDQQVESMKRELDTVKRDGATKRELEKIKGERKEDPKTREEVRKMKMELGELKRETYGAQGHIDQLKQGATTHGEVHHKVGSLQDHLAETTKDFADLKKELTDRGVLTPLQADEEEHVVGALELDEDVFTARLLLRLGFMKGLREEAEEARKLELEARALEGEGAENDSDSEVVPSEDMEDEFVHGLAIPDVKRGQNGYGAVTCGWATICVLTLFIQVFVIVVLIKNASDSSDGCLHEPLPLDAMITLRLSKTFAITVAGALLGKDLMDITNYMMVSALIETHCNWEVAITGTLRVGLTALIGLANVMIFFGMNSPENVWINMTALGFIGELGENVLLIAKRGIFGHHISKNITQLNFQLTFVSEYPAWFIWVRTLVVGGMMVFVGIFAFLLATTPEVLCEDVLSKKILL